MWIVSQDPQLDVADPLRYLTEGMPAFMVPRYYEMVDGLPKTLTNRVHKGRAQGAWKQLPDMGPGDE